VPARMSQQRPITILCLASFHKGVRFLQQCKREGCHVILLTIDKLLGGDWPRESIDEIFGMTAPTLADKKQDVINAVSYLARTRHIDRVVPLDDYDVEVAAMLREHLRLPGMGDTTVRYFRDKLAMREKARDSGITVPRFVHVLNHQDVADFLREVPGPWVLKPRGEAASLGIKRIYKAEDAWPLIHGLQDRQSTYLIEKMIPGYVYHVDAITSERQVVFAEAHRYRRPILTITQEGGVFGTHTLERGSEEETTLLAFHAEVLNKLGFVRGVSHTEFIKSREDGKFYFLETAARAGGAHITDLVEAESGINMWEEWAKVEIRQGKWAYEPPVSKKLYGGLLISLSKQEEPDSSAYNDPEVWLRLHDKKNHVGLVLQSDRFGRIIELMDSYEPRIAHDFQAVLPPPEKATD
jgi:biotin carboxylase